jgi:hypothetical protein
MDSVIDDIYGGKYKPKTKLKLGKVCKEGDEKCKIRRKTFFQTIAKMKMNTACPDGSFRGIPSQSLRNLVGNLGIRKRKNQPKKVLCGMLKDYETLRKKNIMISYGEYKKKPTRIGYNALRGNYIDFPPNTSGLPEEIEPLYRSYDYKLSRKIIDDIPQWLKEDRIERKAYRDKGLKRPVNIKRKRGRPPIVVEEMKEEVKTKRPRGRPKKVVEQVKPILQPIIKPPRTKPFEVGFRF